MMRGIRFIGAADVDALLDMETCLDAVRHSFILEASGRALQPLRTRMTFPDGEGLLGMMPGYLADPAVFGIKVLSVRHGGPPSARSSHQGLVVLFDQESGSPIALLEAGAITAMRTAAASAVATDVLARPDSTVLAVIGCGVQARKHVAAIAQVRTIARVRAWDRSTERAAEFVAELRGRICDDVTVAESAEAVVSGADILCTTTSSSTPVLHGRWLQPGMHLNLVGASVPEMMEVDADVVVRSRVFTDLVASAWENAGELRRALEVGIIDRKHVLGTVGEVLNGTVPGRTSAQQITAFRSLGMIAEDLVVAARVLRLAERRDAGVLVNL